MRPRVVELLDLALLDLQAFVHHRSTVDARWCPRLESGDLESEALELFSEVRRRGLSRSASRESCLRADVNAAPKERSRGDDDRSCAKAAPFERFDAGDPAIVLEQQTRDRALNGSKPAVLLEQLANGPTIQPAVALGARCPDRRTLASIEHSELDARKVRRARHDASESVDLADNGALRDATDRRITRHMSDRVERAGDESHARASTRRGDGRFGPRMTGANHHDVKFGFEALRGHQIKLCARGNDIFKHLMPIQIRSGAPTLFIRRAQYEKTGLVRASIDERLALTPEEFRVEGDLVVIGPVYDADAFASLLDDLEKLGLTYFDDYFELSGNWPAWVSVLVGSSAGPGRSNPSQPHS